MHFHIPLATAAVLCCAWSGVAEAKKATLDAGLSTVYSIVGPTVDFNVCGSLPGAVGCFGGGDLGPFEQACAVLEGTPKQKADVIAREIYVLDKRTSADAPITLTVFKRTDTITNGDDKIDVTQVRQISLGVTGGATSNCAMAANDMFVYAGTDADRSAIVINKKSYVTSVIGGDAPLLKSITADERGYVSIHFKEGWEEGYELFGPSGEDVGGGGGAADMVGTRNAWRP